jgi:hypothetical protein
MELTNKNFLGRPPAAAILAAKRGAFRQNVNEVALESHSMQHSPGRHKKEPWTRF